MLLTLICIKSALYQIPSLGGVRGQYPLAVYRKNKRLLSKVLRHETQIGFC